MSSLLVHVTHGPEAPTRAALACLVAQAAMDEGHDVSLFFAGDGAQLLRDASLESVQGVGTGSLGSALRALVAGGVPIYVSGMSAKARGVDESDLADKGASFAMPAKLVELTFSADRVLCY